MSDAAPATVQVPKAAELVAAQLRRQIVMGARVEGEMLPPEVELMTELGVSRPTLRQALRILETELLVTVHRGRNGGTRVNRPSPEVAGRYLGNVLMFQGATLDDVHTARLLFEPSAVASLAACITEEQIAFLRESVAQSRSASDPEKQRAIGSRFHTALFEMAGNPPLALFANLMQQLFDVQIARFQSHWRRQAAEFSDHFAESHARVVDMLEAGAAREAARVWHQHLDEVHSLLARTIDTTSVLDLEV